MPSLNLSTKTLRYAAADETVIEKAVTLASLMAEYDADTKQDAVTAVNALLHLKKRVDAQRNGKAK